jgi:hypothetical protein
MCFMNRLFVIMGIVAALFVATGGALAQVQLIPPGGSQFNPPLPPPLPSPKIEVPKVPQIDAMPSQSYLPAPRPSFSDRVTTCLDEGAAAGLGAGDRGAYSRACANSR